MPIALFRVDERLLHGQVTVGWGSVLHPARYVVVDDRIAENEWERELYRLGAPSGTEAVFVTVASAREALAAWEAEPEVSVLLTRDIESMLRLARGGRMTGREVNLGGVHHAAGRTRLLPYLYLAPEDRDRIGELEREGIRVWARDLPGAARTRAADLLA